MIFRSSVLLCIAAVCLQAADPVAARLAKLGWRAETDGQIVQAYLLFKEASARDPKNARYAEERATLEPRAKLMMDANLQSGDITADIKQAEQTQSEPAGADQQAENTLASMTLTPQAELEDTKLLPPPVVRAGTELHSFEIRGDDAAILTQVARAYGVEVVFDPDFQPKTGLHLEINDADFHAAMEAATAATGTFAFADSPKRVFVARDTELKRTEYEPEIVEIVPLPNALDPKDIVEVANAVRGAIGLRGAISWNSGSRSIVIRDHISKARAARSVLEALLLPRAQVSFQVQLLTMDSDELYTYGVSPQNTFQLAALGLVSRIHNVTLPSLLNGTTLLAFGGGSSLIGLGVTSAELFANYNQSTSHVLYDATVNVSDSGSATLHVGDKYPIPTSIFGTLGATSNTTGTGLFPVGQVTQEDLGLSLKVSPHVRGNGSIAVDLESEYRTLGSTSLNGVPSINQRSFKGSVTLGEGQWAIIAGMQEEDRSVSKSGVAGLGSLPGVGNLFAQTVRDHRLSDTLVLLKPTITRLPMSGEISPQYLLGPQRGQSVLF